MINIITKSYYHRFISGPQKVVHNLIKGLKGIQYPYVINHRLDACKRLWIQDDLFALRRINQLSPEIKVIVGPHLAITPRDLPSGLNLSKSVYLQPSSWAKHFWEDFGFHACPIEAWPVGIDTDEFVPNGGTKDMVLIYFKRRLPEELNYAESLLKERKIPYRILSYPNYTEMEYKRLLSQSRYIVWIGQSESQGIALQEAMACNVPILLWDITHLGQWLSNQESRGIFTEDENNYPRATAAEFFDETCGIKIKDSQALSESLNRMEERWSSFQPRQYVLAHLNLQKQSREFVNIYQKYFDLTFEDGVNEHILRKGAWINRTIPARLYFLTRDIRRMLKRTAQRF